MFTLQDTPAVHIGCHCNEDVYIHHSWDFSCRYWQRCKKNRKGWHMYCLKLSLQVLELSMECDPIKKMTVNLLTSDCLGTFDMLYGLLHPKLEDIHTWWEVLINTNIAQSRCFAFWTTFVEFADNKLIDSRERERELC